MSLRKISFFILSFVLVLSSCKKDDDAIDIVTIELNDRGEQQVIDNDSLIGYFETHYYNSDFFINNLDASLPDLEITALTDDEITAPVGSRLLIDELNTVANPNGKLELHETFHEEADYEYYILRLNQGGGVSSPFFSDTVQVTYEGSTLDGEVFDSRVNALGDDPLDLVNLIRGWSLVLPKFNTADNFVENGDGTVSYKNYGLGAMFIPSGLAYFSSTIPGSSYAPLIFKFELISAFENDHDFDGIPSYLEDLNGDGEFIVNFDDLTDETDDDTDGDGFPNYVDNDDDGDGILTIFEDIDGDGDPTNDIGVNGIPNYLDPEETESNQ